MIRLSCAALLLPAALLTGCGSNFASNATATSQIKLQGSVHGGQQPVRGATLQLFTVGTTGNASAATPLITRNAVTTDANGSFSITGDYSCASATQVYLVAIGGDSGSGTNSALGLAVALGPCAGLSNSTYININELTTVAAATTLAPFESGSYINIGAAATPAQYATGLANAMGTAALLVNNALGLVNPFPPTGITLPTNELNTLADILAACVNSNGAVTPASGSGTTTVAASPCYTLFKVTGSSNTIDAAFYIAKHPGSSAVTGLFSLVTGTAPFQPTLSAAPADFTVAVKYTGTEIKSPYGIAIDQYGNAFVTNNTGNSVTAAPPLSTTFATSTNTAANAGGLNGPQAISIGTDGYIWVSNHSGNSVVQFAPINNSPVSNWSGANSNVIFALYAPNGIVNDNAGNAYVIGYDYLDPFTSGAGASLMTEPNTNSSLVNAESIAINSAEIITFTNDTNQLCTLPISFTALSTPTCTAVGSSTISLVATNQGSGANVGYATNNGTYGPSSTTGPYSGGGQTSPAAMAFDSAGNVWIADNVSSTFNSGTGQSTSIPANIAELNGSTAISPSSGFATATLGSNSPQGIAIDPSGNVWIADSGNFLAVLIGLAAPTVTPIATIVK